jgi:hypothetical protein
MERKTPNRIAALTYANTGNIGDEIQTVAATRLLGTPDAWFNRDALAEVRPKGAERYWMILNGWFLSRPESWPPAACIHPLFTSFHLSQTPVYGTGYNPAEMLCSQPAIAYLQFHAPIGARDTATRDYLLARGVRSYFSTDLTLTLDRRPGCESRDLAVLVDADPAACDHVARHLPPEAIRLVTHTDHSADTAARMAKAAALLDLYASAKFVVTSRLHCAMPCVGMGIPVLLLDRQDDPRFSGLRAFCHNATTEDFVAGRSGFDIADPPRPLAEHLPYRDALIAQVAQFRQACETGITPGAFAFSFDQYALQQLAMERRRTDLLISMQRRLDAIQGVPNY